MGIKLLSKAGILLAKDIILRSVSHRSQAATKIVDVPKGYLAVYVGETQKKRFLVPISYLNRPLFRDLLHKAEEELGYTHPMGGLTTPCGEDTFLNLTSQFNGL